MSLVPFAPVTPTYEADFCVHWTPSSVVTLCTTWNVSFTGHGETGTATVGDVLKVSAGPMGVLALVKN
jgi:hypothetical protein